MKVLDMMRNEAARREAKRQKEEARQHGGQNPIQKSLQTQLKEAGLQTTMEIWSKVWPLLNGRAISFDLPGKPGGFVRATLLPVPGGRCYNVILAQGGDSRAKKTFSLTAGSRLVGKKTDDLRYAVVMGLATALGVA